MLANEAHPEYRRKTSPILKPNLNKILVLTASLLFLASCGPKVKPIQPQEAIDALKTQAAEVSSCQGRAWISVKSPQQKVSFPAHIWIRKASANEGSGVDKLRMEIMDPLGVTHALLVLNSITVPTGPGKKEQMPLLTWVDFDAKRIYENVGVWNGLSLKALPDLLLGLSTAITDPELLLTGARSEELEFRKGKELKLAYEFRWIDPGPRIALSRISAEQDIKHERYSAQFSHFLDKPDFYLPRDVEVNADQLEVHLAWRERKWNEPIGEIFKLPPLKGFTKE